MISLDVLQRKAGMTYKSLIVHSVPQGLVDEIALQKRSYPHSRPDQRGTCAMWVILITMIKVEQPLKSLDDIVTSFLH